MADLIRSTVFEGYWEGHVEHVENPDSICISFRGENLENVEITKGEDGICRVKAPIPAHAICDGIQNFIVQTDQGEQIGNFSIIAGEAVDHDLRTEIGLLRAELDLLKKAFRRHVVETT